MKNKQTNKESDLISTIMPSLPLTLPVSWPVKFIIWIIQILGPQKIMWKINQRISLLKHVGSYQVTTDVYERNKV